MISLNDVCSCGHTREHHTASCKSLRPVGTGSTPPGFRQHMERCPCLGFVLWRTAEDEPLSDAGYASTAAVLLFCILGTLAFLGFLALGQKAVCEHGSQPLPSYCQEQAK